MSKERETPARNGDFARKVLVVSGTILPILIYLIFAFQTSPFFGPTQEETFGRSYRENVVCSTLDQQNEIRDVFCLEKGSRPHQERQVDLGLLSLHNTALRPEFEIRIGSTYLPILMQPYQGAGYAIFPWLGKMLLGKNLLGLRIPLVLMSITTFLLAFFFLNRHFGHVIAFVSLLLWVFCDATVFTFSVTVYILVLFNFLFFAILLLLFLEPVKTRTGRNHAALIGFLVGLSIYNYFLTIPVLVALFFASLVCFRARLFQLMKWWWVAFPAMLLGLTPIIVYNFYFGGISASLMWDQLPGIRQLPDIFFERWVHVFQVLQGFVNLLKKSGVIPDPVPIVSLGIPYLYFICLIALLIGRGETDPVLRRKKRFISLTALFIVPFSSLTAWSSALQMFVLLHALVPLVLVFGLRDIAYQLSVIFPGKKRAVFANGLFAVLVLWPLAAEGHYSLRLIQSYPTMQGVFIPVSVIAETTRYLEKHSIDGAINVQTEDLYYPIEFFSHGKVRLKHYFSFTGERGWEKEATEQEWDRVLKLNPDAHFLLMNYCFEGLPNDVSLFLEACERNGIKPSLVRIFSNAVAPVFALYRISAENEFTGLPSAPLTPCG